MLGYNECSFCSKYPCVCVEDDDDLDKKSTKPIEKQIADALMNEEKILQKNNKRTEPDVEPNIQEIYEDVIKSWVGKDDFFAKGFIHGSASMLSELRVYIRSLQKQIEELKIEIQTAKKFLASLKGEDSE